MSSWITVLPLAKEHFDLSKYEFCDSLSLRYAKPLLDLPPDCDGCGLPFTVNHALDCKKGGLVVQRHNEVCDVISHLSAMAWNQVVKEPVTRDSSDSGSNDNLRGDIAVRGVWQSQTVSALGVMVLDKDASSYRAITPQTVLSNAEKNKKK